MVAKVRRKRTKKSRSIKTEPLSIEYAGQHVPILRVLTDAAILASSQGRVKVLRSPSLATKL